jgi:3-phosphoshikimate 1-carboxyvinyltransferase
LKEISLHIANTFNAEINLPASKSESNRALIINALSGFGSKINNLSNANDTFVLNELLKTESAIVNAEDAGTVMRFMLAYLALKGEKKVLTGTKRMCERPIGILVDALRTIGATIVYLEKEGFPPLQIGKFEYNNTNEIKINAQVSSQYISALLLIASQLPQGLKIHLEGEISSRPYLELTLGTLSAFGITYNWVGNTIEIKPQAIKNITFDVENDWSAVGYWCSVVSLAKYGKITLKGLKQNTLQGDKRILEIYSQLGVQHHWIGENLVLSTNKSLLASELNIDFTDIPDQAQTVLVSAVALKTNTTVSGIESLKIKETDRITALDAELNKFNSGLEYLGDGKYKVLPNFNFKNNISIETYNDHRMAMSFAPLAVLDTITIKNPDCVQKSFPDFWNEIEKIIVK